MLRTIVLSLTACFFLAGTAAAADVSIGVADMQIAGSQCDAQVAAKNKFENQFKTENTQLDKQKEAFEKKAKEFEAQRGKLDQKAFEERVAGLRREAQQIGEKEMNMQQRIAAIQNGIAQDLAELAVKAAAEVSKEKKLDLMLAQNSVLFAGQSHDVTNDLLQAMNRIWKADGSKVPGTDAANAVPGAPAAAAPAKSNAKKK